MQQRRNLLTVRRNVRRNFGGQGSNLKLGQKYTLYFLTYKITRYDQKQPLTNIDFSKSVLNISNIVFGKRLYLINQFHANVPFTYSLKTPENLEFF